MFSSPSILESCSTEYILKVVKISIILARRLWKVSNFPKIFISLNSNCFSLGFCLSFCFVLWKQCWYSLKLKTKIQEREHNKDISLILLSEGGSKFRVELQNLSVSYLWSNSLINLGCHLFLTPNLENSFFFFFFLPWGMQNFSDQGLNLCPLHCKLGVLTTGPPGEFKLLTVHNTTQRCSLSTCVSLCQEKPSSSSSSLFVYKKLKENDFIFVYLVLVWCWDIEGPLKGKVSE